MAARHGRGSGDAERTGLRWLPAPDGRPFEQRMAWATANLESLPVHGARTGGGCVRTAHTCLTEEQLLAVGTLAAGARKPGHVHACETATELGAGAQPARAVADRGAVRHRGSSAPPPCLAHERPPHRQRPRPRRRQVGPPSPTALPPTRSWPAASPASPSCSPPVFPVALGTDGPASANDLDLWLAMRLAAYPQAALARRRRRARPPPCSRWRRSTGPGPSELGDEIGSIEVGKRADLVVLDASSPSLVTEPTTPLVHCGLRRRPRGDVRWVVVDGRSRRRRPGPHDPSTSTTPSLAIKRPAPVDRTGRHVTRGRSPTPEMPSHEACLQMVADGLVIGSSGNISVRVIKSTASSVTARPACPTPG